MLKTISMICFGNPYKVCVGENATQRLTTQNLKNRL